MGDRGKTGGMWVRDGRVFRNLRLRRVINAVAAVVVSAILLGVLGFGYGTIPALGPALDPGRGAWTSASGGEPAGSQTLRLPGLTAPVTASFSGQGLASISARNDHDLFLALGYVHARFRLSEMDLERRLGEGRLAQLRAEGTARRGPSPAADAAVGVVRGGAVRARVPGRRGQRARAAGRPARA